MEFWIGGLGGGGGWEEVLRGCGIFDDYGADHATKVVPTGRKKIQRKSDGKR